MRITQLILFLNIALTSLLFFSCNEDDDQLENETTPSYICNDNCLLFLGYLIDRSGPIGFSYVPNMKCELKAQSGLDPNSPGQTIHSWVDTTNAEGYFEIIAPKLENIETANFFRIEFSMDSCQTKMAHFNEADIPENDSLFFAFFVKE